MDEAHRSTTQRAAAPALEPAAATAQPFPVFGLPAHLNKWDYFESVRNKMPQLQRAIVATSAAAVQHHYGKVDLAPVVASILSQGAGLGVMNVRLTGTSFSHRQLADALVEMSRRIDADAECWRTFSLSLFFPPADIKQYEANVAAAAEITEHYNAKARAEKRPAKPRPTTGVSGEKRFFRYLAWGAVARLKDVKPEDRKKRQE